MTLTREHRDADTRRGSDFAALCRQVRDLRLLDRRYGSYLVRTVTTLGAFVAAWAGFIWLGDVAAVDRRRGARRAVHAGGLPRP
jgi:hypothetical protein